MLGKPLTWQYDEYARAVEGASGCIRACMIHLDERRKLGNRFLNPFRRKAPWKLSAELADSAADKPSRRKDGDN